MINQIKIQGCKKTNDSFSNDRFSECFILAVTNNKVCVICVDLVVVL